MIRTYLDNTNIWILMYIYVYILFGHIISKCIIPYMSSMRNVNIAYMDPNMCRGRG